MNENPLTPAELSALKREVLSSLHAALPGVVEAYDAAAGRADIRPGLRAPDGRELPLLRAVPVYRPESRDIRPGDLALVIFADGDTEAFLSSGVPSAPVSSRAHSLSDGFAFVGFGADGGR